MPGSADDLEPRILAEQQREKASDRIIILDHQQTAAPNPAHDLTSPLQTAPSSTRRDRYCNALRAREAHGIHGIREHVHGICEHVFSAESLPSPPLAIALLPFGVRRVER